MRSLLALTASLVVCTVLVGMLTAPSATAATPVDCSEIDLPVLGPSQVVHGQLCRPAGGATTTVQLLVHGGTYNRSYWDIPYRPERYSYQRDMAANGFATFAIDRLGTGQSTRPLSALVLHNVEAASVHQVVGQLRAGRVGGVRYDRVILVAHSTGTGVATIEAATYHDVDGLILTGANHFVSVPAIATGAALDLHPAALDPLLSRKAGGDLGYFTTKPGHRAHLFYRTEHADPGVIAADESTKDQLSLVGMGPIAVFGIILPSSLGIDVPVLLMVGQQDKLFCGLLAGNCSSAAALRRQEAPFFSPAARLSTYVQPGSGHAMALHRNAPDYRQATRAWLTTTFPTPN